MLKKIAKRIKDEEDFQFRGYFLDGGFVEFSLYKVNPPIEKDKFLAIVQYSQFKDISNNKICNGDIFTWGKDSRGVVTVKKGRWVIENLNGDFILSGYCKDGKVIGNIFDDEVLLVHKDLKNA